MDRINDLEAFVAIVESGSQSAAARELQRSLQSINRSLMSLEHSVGVALIKRTTRQSHPTEAGLAYYGRVKPAIDEIAQARAEAADLAQAVSGSLRVGAPALLARAFVVPVIADFLARFPRVEVELKASDRAVDLLDERLDVAVRVRHLPDSTLKARHLGDLRLVVFGAKSYLDRHDRPRHPGELARHACLVRAVDGHDEPWPLRIDGRVQAVPVRARLRCNDTAAIQAAALCGLGLGCGPWWQVREWVERGALELVLQEFEGDRMPVQAVLPPTKTQPAKVRLFVDLLAARIGPSLQ
jgi:DNA-binding transcriptional LysR family regulator